MTHNEQIKTIREAYSELRALDLQDGFFDVAKRLLEMNTVAERRHRRGAPNGIKHGLTVKDAAKLFTVKHLLDGWENTSRFSVEDILNIRTEVLYAQAYASRHYATLATWVKTWAEPFKAVDYAKLQQDGHGGAR
jgi:hypothetical protein